MEICPEIVSADALRTVAGAAQGQPVLPKFRLFLLAALVQNARLQHRHRLFLVAVLRTFVLALRHQTGRQVRDADGGISGVNPLPAVTAGAENVDPEFALRYHDIVILIRLREHHHRGRRSVDAPLRLGFRDPLEMDSVRNRLDMVGLRD